MLEQNTNIFKVGTEKPLTYLKVVKKPGVGTQRVFEEDFFTPTRGWELHFIWSLRKMTLSRSLKELKMSPLLFVVYGGQVWVVSEKFKDGKWGWLEWPLAPDWRAATWEITPLLEFNGAKNAWVFPVTKYGPSAKESQYGAILDATQEDHLKRRGDLDRQKLEVESKMPGGYGWSHEQSARIGMHSFMSRKLKRAICIDGGLPRTHESPRRGTVSFMLLPSLGSTEHYYWENSPAPLPWQVRDGGWELEILKEA